MATQKSHGKMQNSWQNKIATTKQKKPRQNKKVTAKQKSHGKIKKSRQNEKAAAK